MRSHPFRHASLGTVDAQGLPQVRRVVLREATRFPASLGFYTDVRSPKVAELRARPAASLLFWDAGRRWQVRASTSVVLHHHDDVTQRVALKAPPSALEFLTVSEAPGSAQLAPAPLRSDVLSPELAWERLVVARAAVTSLDVLQLHDDGPLRALYTWLPGGEVHGTWTVP